MRTETIQCDCCLKNIEKGQDYLLEVCFKVSTLGNLPQSIILEDACEECVHEIHKMINDFIQAKGKRG